MRKILLTAILLVAPLALSWALGDPEAGDYEPVSGLENWDHRLELEGRKAGKYNLIVRGIDQAGNTGYGGPYNVFVDPQSDLPVVHISNPATGARVSAQLHVVGTCIDDDGVKAVELQLDDGEFRPAEGTEFWSLDLNMESIPDGEHTLTARCEDTGGTPGKPQSVRFRLDKMAPQILIESHQSGVLVSGTVELAGTVEDANGVASLGMSRDEGKSYESVRLNLDKPGTRGTFRVSLDTRESPDGPMVLWFRAADRTGSVAQYAFLLFANNDAPTLEILFPEPGASVNGRVLVCGRARDKVGLRALRYQLDDDQGEIELTPGNPFWVHELDLTGSKAGTVQVTYTLQNRTGNTQSLKLRLKVDPEGDRPRITVSTPEAGARIQGAVRVCGFASDDDGVQDVEYALDGGAAATVPASAAFSLTLADVAPGAHKLLLKPVDINGVAGEPVELPFVELGPPPTIGVRQLTDAAGSTAFSPGMTLSGEKDGRLTGVVRFSGGSVQAEYVLQGASVPGSASGPQGGPPRSLALKRGETPEERVFELLLPKSLPAGRVELWIKATDALGAAAEYRSFLFKGGEQGESGILLVDGRLSPDGSIRLDERPLTGRLAGATVQGVELDPPAGTLRAEAEGPLFRVYALSPGVTGPTRIRVTGTDGRAYSTEPIRFLTDFAPPEITVEAPGIGESLSRDLSLRGRVSDVSGVVGLEYCLDGGAPQSLPLEPDGQGGRFGATLPVGSLSEGLHLLSVRAVDGAGNSGEALLPFQKDGIAPALQLIAPQADEEVNGLTTVVGRVEDAGRDTLVEVSEDGQSYREVGRGELFHFDVNLSRLPAETGGLLLRCTDAAGNVSQLSPELTVDIATDRPVAQIQLPAPGELIRHDFVLSGMVFDDDGVASIQYRLDGGEAQKLPGGNNFSVPISLEGIEDNEHTVEVVAEDPGGLLSEVAVSRFSVSKSDPVSVLEYPHVSDQLCGIVELRGRSQDPNGIAAVRISLDNGLSFYDAEGTESWHYLLDTRLLSDDTHAILVQAVDSTGAEGLYTSTINIDNHAPELVLDSPGDGQAFTEGLRLSGRCTDNVELATLALSVSAISAASASDAESSGLQAPLPLDGVLAQQIDLGALAPGWYNLRIEASDEAGNRSYVSRNVLKEKQAEQLELLFPADGESLAGPFGVSGRLVSDSAAGVNVLVLVDGQPLDTAALSAQGYFHLEAGAGTVRPGEHALQVEAVLPAGLRLSSEPHRFRYVESGPWVRITSFLPGDYVSGRPFLEGEAGYQRQPPAGEAAPEAGKKATSPEPKVRLVEVSMDNGKSFQKAEGRGSWRQRLETQQLANGPLRLLIKATFDNGETAVTRTQLTVDTRAPKVTLLSPSEGGKFNDAITLAGTAGDESGLREIAVSLRQGDKSRYQVPAFIQGLYLDLHAMGATYWDAGLGLTFFDDNVKLQLQVGMSPPGRFSGLVLGAKLLANIATVPFGYFFGPSWDFFSMSVAVGASFSYFSMSEGSLAFTAEGLVLGSIVAQLEFARFHIASWRAFNDYSLYTEYQLWFISSDVEAGTVSRIAFGLRMGLL
jgi:hypothetical protein